MIHYLLSAVVTAVLYFRKRLAPNFAFGFRFNYLEDNLFQNRRFWTLFVREGDVLRKIGEKDSLIRSRYFGPAFQ